MANFFIWIIAILIWSAVAFIMYRLGYERGYDVADFLSRDNMEKAGRVLFITKQMDVDEVIISDGANVIIYERKREI